MSERETPPTYRGDIEKGILLARTFVIKKEITKRESERKTTLAAHTCPRSKMFYGGKKKKRRTILRKKNHRHIGA